MKCSLCKKEKENLVCQDCLQEMLGKPEAPDLKESLDLVEAVLSSFKLLLKTPATFRKARKVERELMKKLKDLKKDLEGKI